MAVRKEWAATKKRGVIHGDFSKGGLAKGGLEVAACYCNGGLAGSQSPTFLDEGDHPPPSSNCKYPC